MMSHNNSNQDSDDENFYYESDIIVTEKGSYAEAKVTDVLELIIEAIEEPNKHKL